MRQRRFLHLDRLETALQRRVLLHVLAVLVESRRPDGLQLSPRQHRLENARGVDRTLGRPGADESVDLVDEENDVAAGPDLLEDLLQPFLEVPAVPRAGDQRAEVEGVELLVLERLGHLALDDALGQPLHDRRLADTRFADEHRVVLGPPGEDLHDPLDLLLPADHGVELALPRGLGEVAAELVEHERTGRGALGRAARRRRLLALVPRQQLDDLLPHPVEVGAELHQHLGCDALALPDEPEEDVLGTDVVVPELQRLTQRELEHLLRPRRERDVPRRGLLSLPDDLLHLFAHGVERDAQGLQRLGRDALALVDQPEKDVLGTDVVVVQHPGLLLSQDDDTAGAVGEPLEHAHHVPSGAPRTSRIERHPSTPTSIVNSR